MSVDKSIQELKETHRLREDHHTQEKSVILRIKAICRRKTGEGRVGGAGKGPIKAPLATALYNGMEAIHKGTAKNPTKEQKDLYMHCSSLFMVMDMLRKERHKLEKIMEDLVLQLPIWNQWGKGVKGLGILTMGKIIAETGNLSDYDGPAKVWKRMGLGVDPEGKRQRKVAGVDGIKQGYSPRRRAVMWNCGDVIIKSKRDNDIPYYYTVYSTRKELEKLHHPEMSDGHAHNRAKRYMEKQLLKHLFNEWKALSSPVPKPIVAAA